MNFAHEIEGINIIPDMVTWAQKQEGTYDVIGQLRHADAFPAWVFGAVDCVRVQNAQILKIVNCDPFQYVSATRRVFQYRVLFYQSNPVCLLATGLTLNNRWCALWLSPNYLDFVIEKLLAYRVKEYLTSIDVRGQTAWSVSYEKAFVLHLDRPYIRINDDVGDYADVYLVRWDSQPAKAARVELSRHSVTIYGLDNTYSMTDKLVMTRSEFDDEYLVYREVVPQDQLPFHLTEMRFN